jgi:hypothetical protein
MNRTSYLWFKNKYNDKKMNIWKKFSKKKNANHSKFSKFFFLKSIANLMLGIIL